MEQSDRPARYSEEEWQYLRDVGDYRDTPIPDESYPDVLEGILRNIAAHAKANAVDPPQIVLDILEMKKSDYRYIRWWIGGTELELQLWAGDQKADITSRVYKR